MAAPRLATLSLVQASRLLETRACTSSELLSSCLDQLAHGVDRGLNAWARTEHQTKLHDAAKAADARRESGAALGPLDGVPVCIKDNFCQRNHLTTAASKILEGFESPYDATVVERLEEAGAIIVGATNMDEFAMGSASVFSRFGPVVNPWSTPDGKELVAGGSSGGSAVAVASGAAYGAVGSDTGGSVRLPASYCGVVGLKPTYGRVSRWGLIAMANSLDVPGLFGRSVGDVAMLLDAVSGPDGKDSTALPQQDPVSPHVLEQDWTSTPLQGIRVGLPAEFALDELAPHVIEAWDQCAQWLADAGAEVVQVSVPTTKLALPAYYVLTPAESASNLACYDGVRYGVRAEDDGEHVGQLDDNSADMLHASYTRTRSQGFGPEVQRRIMVGNYVLSESAREAYVGSAVAVRRALVKEFDAVWESGVDVMLTPTCPSGPFPVSEAGSMDPMALYVNDVMTAPANLTGAPAVSVPVAIDHQDGCPVPIGMQLIGRACHEGTMLRAAALLEDAACFADLVPAHVCSE